MFKCSWCGESDQAHDGSCVRCGPMTGNGYRDKWKAFWTRDRRGLFWLTVCLVSLGGWFVMVLAHLLGIL